MIMITNERTNERTNDSIRSYDNSQVIGDIFEENGYGSAGGRVYSKYCLAPCIGASHFQQVKYIVVRV